MTLVHGDKNEKEELKMAKKKTENSNIEEVVEVETVKTQTVYGIVSGCQKLNIRKRPSIKADPICTVDAKTKLTIFTSESTKDWYNVSTKNGVIGYCMKKYITVEE